MRRNPISIKSRASESPVFDRERRMWRAQSARRREDQSAANRAFWFLAAILMLFFIMLTLWITKGSVAIH